MHAANGIDTPLVHQPAVVESAGIFKVADGVQAQVMDLYDIAGQQG